MSGVSSAPKIIICLSGTSLAENQSTVLERQLKRYASKVDLPYITPHKLRHACGTHLVRNGSSIKHVQDILGHERIGTTEKYVEVTIQDIHDMIESLHPRGGRA